jgi:putative DNA primase/helicase
MKDNTNTNKAKPTNANSLSHDEVLEKLIQSVETFDFMAFCYPEKEDLEKQMDAIQGKLYVQEPDGSLKQNPKLSKENAKALKSQLEDLQKKVAKFKLNQKHFVVGTVHHILETSKKCNWGLCKNLGFVYVFNGEFWKPLEEDELKTFLSKAANKAGVEKIDALHYEFVDKLNKQFLLNAHLPNPKESDEYLINLQNGTFKISNGKFILKNFDRNDFLKYQLPFAYDPEATAPTFLRFIDEVLPDPERQKVLSEFFGHLFTNIKLEKALLCYGGGANGKSVFFEIINAMLGAENVSNYSLQSLTEEKGYHRAMLANKLINYASEISGKLKTDLFKGLSFRGKSRSTAHLQETLYY